ncbi:hypothetical protein BX264_2545 [Streptomyces sp. 2333.5]|nr:hypothetical protein BX264_2545 [Streptomyces sp. 2333.5]SED00232.1 hypothetical protein SAMN05428943_2683 [Streptomyces sp. 2314.4]SED86423.1 hypothetical protein SAMN05428942_2647 [Streptomyces sp. 2112.2]
MSPEAPITRPTQQPGPVKPGVNQNRGSAV